MAYLVFDDVFGLVYPGTAYHWYDVCRIARNNFRCTVNDEGGKSRTSGTIRGVADMPPDRRCLALCFIDAFRGVPDFYIKFIFYRFDGKIQLPCRSGQTIVPTAQKDCRNAVIGPNTTVIYTIIAV